MSNLRKFIVALVGVIALGLQQFLGIGDGTSLFGISVDQIVNIVIALLTAIGVYQVPNTPTDPA